MPTFNDASVPDHVRKDITSDQAEFLKRNISQEAAGQGLTVSCEEIQQPDGLITLVIHFTQRNDVPQSSSGERAAAPSVGDAARDSVIAVPVIAPVVGGALAWGAKVSAAFRDRVRAIASGLETNPDFLMAAMAFETGRTFTASQLNKAGSGAVGLIQFMPRTAEGLGTSSGVLAAMTAEEQLDMVQKYFSPYKGKLHTLSDLYMAILWPAAVSRPDDAVLFSLNINPAAYRQNAGLDANHDGKVTKSEAASKVQDMLTEGLRPGNIG